MLLKKTTVAANEGVASQRDMKAHDTRSDAISSEEADQSQSQDTNINAVQEAITRRQAQVKARRDERRSTIMGSFNDNKARNMAAAEAEQVSFAAEINAIREPKEKRIRELERQEREVQAEIQALMDDMSVSFRSAVNRIELVLEARLEQLQA